MRALALVAALLAATGCAKRLKRTITPDVASVDRESPFLKAHMRDGRVYILSAWSVNEQTRTVSGSGELLTPERTLVQRGPFTVAVADVAIFETNVVSTSPQVAALAVISGISLGVTAFCIINPKACFGSCPTFYVEGADLLHAEGFSDSVAPSLAATDVDALYRVASRPGPFSLRMTNEALETHVVQGVHLLAVPRGGGRVFRARDGTFWRSPVQHAATACHADDGDCLAAVRAFDSVERFGPASETDLAEREVLELTLPPVPGRTGLVIAARQTLLSTFVLYQGLAYMGSQVGRWLAALENGDRSILRARSFLGVLGGIDVEVETDAGWVVAGTVDETGPLATDVHLVPLPPHQRVRLRMTRGHWRLDWLALAGGIEPVTPIRLAPERIRGSISREFAPGRAPATSFPIVTQPGDAYTFVYRVPEGDHELFLESRGYYLEWMREEWLREENPLAALRMIFDPAGALRALAPAFKQQEHTMEALFWGSRYAP